MPVTPQTTDSISSTRPPHTPSPVDIRWYRLALVAVGLAVGVVSTLAFQAPDRPPAITSVPTTYPEPIDDQPWYEPQPPCWITNTCPRATSLWLDSRPHLYPTPGSPAAFRLADQRSLLGTAFVASCSPITAWCQSP